MGNISVLYKQENRPNILNSLATWGGILLGKVLRIYTDLNGELLLKFFKIKSKPTKWKCHHQQKKWSVGCSGNEPLVKLLKC